MYTIIFRKKERGVHSSLVYARGVLRAHPEAHIRYSREAIRKYEITHEALKGERERGKKKSEKTQDWRRGYRLQSRNS